MASQKQIDANRENAKKSTGPRSSTGKARSRLNAIRDALTGQITTLSATDRPFFDKLRSEILADLDPKTAMERELTNAIAWDTWRLNHLRSIEMSLYAFGEDDDDDAEEAGDNDGDSRDPDEYDFAHADAHTFRRESSRLDKMSLYEQRMNRNIHRNLTELRRLQTERKRNYERDRQEEIRIARLLEFNKMTIHASTRPSRNGFVFSTEDIAQAAVRQRYLETADWVKKNANPRQLYGNLTVGVGDSYLETVLDPNSPSPEVLTAQRLRNPEQFGVHP